MLSLSKNSRKLSLSHTQINHFFSILTLNQSQKITILYLLNTKSFNFFFPSKLITPRSKFRFSIKISHFNLIYFWWFFFLSNWTYTSLPNIILFDVISLFSLKFDFSSKHHFLLIMSSSRRQTGKGKDKEHVPKPKWPRYDRNTIEQPDFESMHFLNKRFI